MASSPAAAHEVAGAALELLRRQTEIETQYLRDDLGAFVREAWHVLEPMTPLVWNWHLDVICAALMDVSAGRCKRLLINVPPGHMKSMIVAVIWPAWQWLTNPGKRIVFSTYAASLTLRDADKARYLMESDWYQRIVPSSYGARRRKKWSWDDTQNAKGFYQNTSRGFRYSTSLEGQSTGHRGDIVAVDDPMKATEYPTKDKLERVISWWNVEMSSRVNNQTQDAFVIIMQRVHDNDLSGHILKQDEANKNKPGWIPYRHICLATEFDPDQPRTPGDPRTQRGELMFPALFPQPVVDRIKVTLGVFAYAGQHGQRPAPAGGGILRTHALCFWLPHDLDRMSVPPPVSLKDEKGNAVSCRQASLPKRLDVEALSWDMAFKGEDSSDPVAGQHWGQRGANLYLLSQRYGRFSFTKTLAEFRDQVDACPRAIAKYVEDKANGTAIMDTLQDEIAGLIAVEPKGGKEARAHAASPLIDAGNIWLPHPALYPWVHDLIAEMASFPFGDHDDQIDAFTQAALQMTAGLGGGLLEAMTTM